MTMPSLPEVQAYTTDEYLTHAKHYETLADNRRRVYGAVKDDADTMLFTGQGADGMRPAVDEHHGVAIGTAGELESAAQYARKAASVLDGQQRGIVKTWQDATDSGMLVSPVPPYQTVPNTQDPVEFLSRMPDALAVQEQLGQQVAEFTAQDLTTGGTLAGTTAKLAGIHGLDMPTGGPDTDACRDAIKEQQDDTLRKIERAALWGMIWGGVAGGIPTDGIGAIPGMVLGGAGAGIGTAILNGDPPTPAECKPPS